MADNAPNSVNRPPFPNSVFGFNRRVDVHVVNITGADGSVTYNAARSSPGTGCTRPGEGRYLLTFPAGGAGCLGWVVASAVESGTSTKAIARVFSLDNDAVATPFVSGSLEMISVDLADSPIINDVIGDVTFLVYIVKAPA